MNVLPDPRLVPPVAAVYQYTVPLLDTALRTTEPAPHLEPGVIEVMVGEELIVTLVDEE